MLCPEGSSSHHLHVLAPIFFFNTLQLYSLSLSQLLYSKYHKNGKYFLPVFKMPLILLCYCITYYLYCTIANTYYFYCTIASTGNLQLPVSKEYTSINFLYPPCLMLLSRDQAPLFNVCHNLYPTGE